MLTKEQFLKYSVIIGAVLLMIIGIIVYIKKSADSDDSSSKNEKGPRYFTQDDPVNVPQKGTGEESSKEQTTERGIKRVYSDPHFIDDRSVITHLMEWKYTEIAKECEEFLGPYGYGGVQVSPIQATAIILIPYRPWWEKYQPVSYNIINRSGNEDEFKNMVDRCNKAKVRVYVDVVLNHMTDSRSGIGTDGTSFDGKIMRYDGPPFSNIDFHGFESCPAEDMEIQDFSDPIQVRNCHYGESKDLNQERKNVRNKQTEFLNKLIDIGVAGFRSTHSKYMWPHDLKQIMKGLKNLNTKYFAEGVLPFWYHDFISHGSNQIKAEEYIQLGRIIDYRAIEALGETFRHQFFRKLKSLKNFGEEMGYIKSEEAVILVDSHNLQRAQAGHIDTNLAFFEPKLLKMATAFILAFPYAVPQVMSSYLWPRDVKNVVDVNYWIGPPNLNGNVINVTTYADKSCAKDWICEHRWREIYNMVKFRNVAGNEKLSNWWDNGHNAIAFSRGNKAFIVINNDEKGISQSFQTGLPAGQYCDIISATFENGKCIGNVIKVDTNGTAQIDIHENSDDPMVAIHMHAKL